MLTQLETKMRGGPENDYPNGDYVWPCMHCDAEFHGDQYDYMCHKCAMEEDRQNSEDPDEMDNIDLMFVILAVIVFSGLIFL